MLRRPMPMLLQTAPSLAADYGTTLLESALVLAVTAGVAYLAMRTWGARFLLGVRPSALRVEQSFRLDAHSGLVIVEIEGRRLLLATHASAAPRLLLELGKETAAEAPDGGSAP